MEARTTPASSLTSAERNDVISALGEIEDELEQVDISLFDAPTAPWRRRSLSVGSGLSTNYMRRTSEKKAPLYSNPSFGAKVAAVRADGGIGAGPAPEDSPLARLPHASRHPLTLADYVASSSSVLAPSPDPSPEPPSEPFSSSIDGFMASESPTIEKEHHPRRGTSERDDADKTRSPLDHILTPARSFFAWLSEDKKKDKAPSLTSIFNSPSSQLPLPSSNPSPRGTWKDAVVPNRPRGVSEASSPSFSSTSSLSIVQLTPSKSSEALTLPQEETPALSPSTDLPSHYAHPSHSRTSSAPEASLATSSSSSPSLHHSTTLSLSSPTPGEDTKLKDDGLLATIRRSLSVENDFFLFRAINAAITPNNSSRVKEKTQQQQQHATISRTFFWGEGDGNAAAPEDAEIREIPESGQGRLATPAVIIEHYDGAPDVAAPGHRGSVSSPSSTPLRSRAMTDVDALRSSDSSSPSGAHLAEPSMQSASDSEDEDSFRTFSFSASQYSALSKSMPELPVSEDSPPTQPLSSSSLGTDGEKDIDLLQRCMERLFHEDGAAITPKDMSLLRVSLSRSQGRKEFANVLTKHRAKKMCIPSANFVSLCEIMEAALNECERASDFKTARVLMYMGATYFRKIGEIHEFVQSRLGHLVLWKNDRFWSDALSDAIASETNKIVPIEQFRALDPAQQDEFVEREKNIAFSTICAFSHNMLSLHVPVPVSRSFVNKWCMFYSLSEEQRQQLMLNVGSLAASLAASEKERSKVLKKEGPSPRRDANWWEKREVELTDF